MSSDCSVCCLLSLLQTDYTPCLFDVTICLLYHRILKRFFFCFASISLRTFHVSLPRQTVDLQSLVAISYKVLFPKRHSDVLVQQKCWQQQSWWSITGRPATQWDMYVTHKLSSSHDVRAFCIILYPNRATYLEREMFPRRWTQLKLLNAKMGDLSTTLKWPCLFQCSGHLSNILWNFGATLKSTWSQWCRFEELRSLDLEVVSSSSSWHRNCTVTCPHLILLAFLA